MQAAIIQILHWPLFPVIILALLVAAYWQGYRASRNKKQAEALGKPRDEAK